VKVSVIISNRNDTSMLAITVRSVLEELRDIPGGGEVVICDNSDKPIYEAIAAGSYIAKQYFIDGDVKLIRQEYPCLFTARETAIRASRGQYVLCLDGHMLVGRRMIRDMVDFMNLHRSNKKLAFAHAPISWLHQHEKQAKHDRNVTKNELGPWGAAYAEPRRITWKGMPWICRKQFFLNDLGGYGALFAHKISWGGGDMHIGVKPWLLGFENWAVPTRPAFHIGPFPKPAEDVVKFKHHYRIYSESGAYPASFGFLLSCFILGGDEMVARNRDVIKKRFGWRVSIDEHIEIAKKLGAEEKAWLTERQVMTFAEWLKNKPWEKTDANKPLPKDTSSVRDSGPKSLPV